VRITAERKLANPEPTEANAHRRLALPAGGLKRHANKAVRWKRECIEIQAQIDGLPQNIPHHGGGGRVKDPLRFGM
jgi:hypothetical protein